MAFSAVAGLAAQLTASARAATGFSISFVAVTYALRAVGDLAEPGPSVLSWLSPIGWNQQIRAFAGDRWWVLVAAGSLCLVLVPAAFALRARRDLGAGLRAERPGPAVGFALRRLGPGRAAAVPGAAGLGRGVRGFRRRDRIPGQQRGRAAEFAERAGPDQAAGRPAGPDGGFPGRGDQHHGGAGGGLWGVLREPPAQRGGRGPHRSAAGDGHNPRPLGEQPLRLCPGRGRFAAPAGGRIDRGRRRFRRQRRRRWWAAAPWPPWRRSPPRGS